MKYFGGGIPMADGTNATAATPQGTVFGEVQRNWGWLLALGILFIVLGTLGLGMTVALTVASVIFFGIFILVGGILQLIQTFKCKGWKSILWHVIIGVLYIVAGFLITINPVGASLVLTMFLAVTLIVVGIIRIIVSFQVKDFRNWIWPFLGGIVSIILGGIIWAQWPISGLWVIGLFVAIELIVQGWSNIFLALAAKGAGQPQPAA